MTAQGLKQSIDALVEGHRDEIIAGLSTLLKFRTVGGDPAPEAEEAFRAETLSCLEFLKGEAQRMGLEWRCHDNELAIAAIPFKGKFVAMPVHVDVVPAGEGWTHDPFGGEVADGVIWGRGCQDDKGPVIQCLWAINLLQKLERPYRRGARLVVGTAEEFGHWDDIRRYPELEQEPEFTIVSDACFPIVNGEKGMLNLKMIVEVPDEGAPEDGGFYLVSAHAGDRANVVPAKAELRFGGDPSAEISLVERELDSFLKHNPESDASLSRPEDNPHDVIITFRGRSAHGSCPQEGHNAAVDMLQFITESGFVTDEEADMAEFLFSAGIDTTGEGLDVEGSHEILGDTTSNLGVVDWQGGKVEATFNIRPTLGFPAEESYHRAKKRLDAFSEETGFSVSSDAVGSVMDAIHVDPNQYPEFIEALQSAYEEVTGREAKLLSIGGSTYAKAFPRAVCFGPVEPAEEEDLIHKVDERISEEHLLRNVKIYTLALAHLCLG